jgi:large subunit ribosomal protein L18
MAKMTRKQRRERIHARMRRRLEGTPERPRLAIHRTLAHIYVQAIDDRTGVTLAAASTADKALRAKLGTGGNVAAAKAVGALIAERLSAKGLKAVVFDRGGFGYHGRVRALAEAARAGGLEF